MQLILPCVLRRIVLVSFKMFTIQFIILIGLLIKQSTAYLVYKTIKMECLPNPEYIQNVSCRLRAVSWQKAVSNMDCDIVGEISNASLHMQVFAKDYTNQYRPFLINVTTNLCDILSKRNFPAYTTIVMRILREVSNVNHSCPFVGHLIARNLYLNEQFMPISPPIQVYKIVLNFLDGWPYKNLGTVILYIQAMEQLNRKKLSKGVRVNGTG